MFELFYVFFGQEAYALHIYVYGSFYAPSAGFRHAAPVGKRVRDQIISRNVYYGVVPVSYAYRRKQNINDFAVRALAGDFNPVAYADKIV